MVAKGAYLEVETRDQLVRLNLGAIPEELDVPDWAHLEGDMLYLLIRSTGEVQYLYVPLDIEMLRRLRESNARKEDGVYLDSRGEPTQLAMYLALVFLERDVSASAIQRELGMSDITMRWLLDVWQCATGVIDPHDLLQLIRLLTFEGNGHE